LDYELFFQAQQDFKKTELLRVNLMRRLAAFDLLNYRAALWKHGGFNILNDPNETNRDSDLELVIFPDNYPGKMQFKIRTNLNSKTTELSEQG
jgi:hypothetical protein